MRDMRNHHYYRPRKISYREGDFSPAPPRSTQPLPSFQKQVVQLPSQIEKRVRWLFIKRLINKANELRSTGRQIFKQHRLGMRLGTGFMAILAIFSLLLQAQQTRQYADKYNLQRADATLLHRPLPQYADKLQLDKKSGDLKYNDDYAPMANAAGQSGSPKFKASFSSQAGEVSVTDVVNETTFSLKPKFPVGSPQKNQNRVVYPLLSMNAASVHSLGGSAIKDDIVVYEHSGDSLQFQYEVKLPSGTEIRQEQNGALAVYGVDSSLLGNVSTGSDKDAELLEKARTNGKKTKLLFTIPAPIIMEGRKQQSDTAQAWFTLDDKIVTLHASNLGAAKYPLSIDPSIYIETAAKLMYGNNETNTDFDATNELIQKSQTTGARIDAWENNQDMNQGTWDNGTAVAGGYIYSVGGRTGTTMPYIVGTQSSTQATDSSTFTMSMPSVRPAGDLYVAMMCHDGTGTVSTVPAGWTKVSATDTDEFDAWYKVGTDQGGGNEAASYDWGGISEEWTGVMMRIKGFDSASPISGTPGTANTSGTPTFAATTPASDATLVLKGIGINDDDPSTRTWVPSGHTKVYSGSSSTGANSCGFAAATQNVPPASGVSTGTTALTQSTLSDTYGGVTMAIKPATVSAANVSSVYWAKFNTTSQAIESPNPGNGTCTDWCTDSAYNLPEARRGFATVAYNGYLYVMGGSDGTNLESTVFIAKLGANGEPQLWHPTSSNKSDWVYWYTDTGLNGATARYHHAAYAYNSRMYIVGGDTNTTANSGSSTTVEYAEIGPNGQLGTWSSGTALPTARYDHNVFVYNDVMYLIGGNNNGTMLATAHYAKINTTTGALNSWTSTNAFTTARATMGGNFATIWGAYLYIAGGCTAVNASGYCTTYTNSTQLASINADGSLTPWTTISGLENQRVGYNFMSWQGALYRVTGCVSQNTSTGECTVTVADVDYGVINEAGEVSTVDITVPSGTAPCSGASPTSCDLPTAGDDAGEIGQMLNMTVVLNGYLYVIGGCAEYNCNDGGNSPNNDNISSNTAYVAISSTGSMVAPPSCGGTSYGAWCVDNTNTINSADGVAAAGVTVFNNRIYVIGGLDSTANETGELYYNSVSPTTGALSGGWTTQTLSSVGISENIFYTYAYARANPASAGTYPGNLYVFGGCGNGGSGAGCSSSDYETEVYKCWIESAGAIEDTAGSASFDCTTSGQLQIDSTPGSGGTDGLGIHSGTVYANYIYLIGGFSQAESDKDDVLYAKFDNNNDVVAVSGSDWIESPNKLSTGRRRGWAFGYNGHIYAVGGYDASGSGTIIPFIEWSKMNVSDGSIDPFITSSIQINQRWGLSMVVSNSYAYVIGGCDVGASPSSCSSFEDSIQTFQLYNNDSGAVNDYTANANNFTTSTDRIGASSAVRTDPGNGKTYVYVAGGCTTNTGDTCTAAVSSVQFAEINASDGSLGAWSAGGSLPGVRTWGSLEVAGDGSNSTLYYIGGQDSTATNEQSTVYFTSGISTGNPTWNGSPASNGLPGARTRFSSAVWDNRIYVVGGLDGSAAVSATVYVSPNLSSGSDIGSAWTTSTSFNYARTGAAVTAYANNLYLFGGFDGTNYMSDVQFAALGYKTGTIGQSGTTVTGSGTTFTSAMVGSTIQYSDGSKATITAYSSATSITVDVSKTVTAGAIYVIQDGSVGSWSYSTSLPFGFRDAQAISANGYIYVTAGRTAATTCNPKTLITPISANTTIATGNNPTGVGEWYETNVRYSGDRYGAAISYYQGKLYTMGGGCVAPVTSNRHYYSTLKSQPQVAKYSKYIDTDTNVFPTYFLMNGLDNSIGARWQMRYKSSPAGSGGGTTTSYSYTGGTQTYVVPSGVTSVSVDVVGAKGENGNEAGGNGGRVQATLTVTPGETLNIYVGGQASWNGGGNGPGSAGNGGDASDIRQGGTALGNRVIVAGGGGGGDSNATGSGNGGAGGGLTGVDGGAGAACSGGGNGTQSAGGGGGSGGFCSVSGSAGSSGTGGAGGNSTQDGGGGGGGYYGGGGGGGDTTAGDESGGGGGSSYINSSVAVGYHTQGYNSSGNGSISITANPSTTIYGYTGSAQNFTVPTGVTNVQVDVVGSKGIDGLGLPGFGGAGGNGGRVQATLKTTPGETLNIYVGGQAGWNGGATGFASNRGGDASDIRQGGTALGNRVVVAGGGGGGGSAVAGGAGGNTTGAAGGLGSCTGAAGGGTPSAGGAAGTGTVAGSAGSSGNGGAGGNGSTGDGGGGGGGYYGGGGGCGRNSGSTAGGGGGGSSYSDATQTSSVTHTQGYSSSNSGGYISISYSLPVWGTETNYGNVSLGEHDTYTPLDTLGQDTDVARYFFLFISIDASKTFGYPEDVNRGPTVSDITLFFTSDPSKRMRHGKTFTGGLQQPLDTPPPAP